MSIETDVQQLNPGPILEFWELNATSIGGGIVRFQGQQDGVMVWQGVEYDAWPCQGEGFERTSDQQPTPKFLVGNVNRAITILCQQYDDLVGATLTRHRTFAKYLDAVNFTGPNMVPGGGAFTSPASIAGWTVTLGTVAVEGTMLRVGSASSVSAAHFTISSEAGKLYRIKMRVDASGGNGNIRAGVALDSGSLGVLGVLPGEEGTFTFTGTGGTVYVQVYRATNAQPAYINSVSVALEGVNPTADPTKEFPPELWFVERKAAESFEAVEFELSSALNFMGVRLPRRQIIANQCPFQYRDANCNYTGPAVADELDQPTSDPLLDKCGRRLSSCKLRLWPDGVLNFGGFPAAGLVRT